MSIKSSACKSTDKAAPEAKSEAAAAKKSRTPKPKAGAAKSKASAKKTTSKSGDPALYTKPELREKLKDQITAGDKGGRPGQWSARKAQLLASEYEKEGGGYKKGSRTGKQKHLEEWTEEKWQTADGKKAERGKTTARYLPKEAWEKLTPAQRKETDEKKKKTSRTGKQFVANTPAASKARKAAQKS